MERKNMLMFQPRAICYISYDQLLQTVSDCVYCLYNCST